MNTLQQQSFSRTGREEDNSTRKCLKQPTVFPSLNLFASLTIHIFPSFLKSCSWHPLFPVTLRCKFGVIPLPPSLLVTSSSCSFSPLVLSVSEKGQNCSFSGATPKDRLTKSLAPRALKCILLVSYQDIAVLKIFRYILGAFSWVPGP